MLAVGERGLVARDAVTDVDPLYEPMLRERVEHPVDARDPYPPARGADTVEDLLRRLAARLRAEVLDDRPSRPAAAEAGVAQPGQRVVAPGCGCTRRGHTAMIAILKDVLSSPRMFSRIVLVLVVALTASGCA